MTDLRYMIGLSLVPEVGPVISRRLLAALGSPEDIFRADIDDLMAIRGLGREAAENIRNFRSWQTVDQHLSIVAKGGMKIVGYHDQGYPEVLKEVEGAPIVLYIKGDYQDEDRYGLAVVGSRNHTPYGESVAFRIAGELSCAGFTIVSGMARGIDTVAHQSSLSAGGRTIAVLGSGLDVVYPAENRGLMERIAAAGCVISEFPLGTMPARENFPRRNRLISGLSLGVLVVEAAVDSGSLITARYALEQNREVFAIPGNITSVSSEGSNRLIREGAKVVLRTEDIIEELGPMLKGFITPRKKETAALTGQEGELCRLLSREPKHLDLVSREAGMPVHRVMELLLSLELKGVVRQSLGQRFYLA